MRTHVSILLNDYVISKENITAYKKKIVELCIDHFFIYLFIYLLTVRKSCFYSCFSSLVIFSKKNQLDEVSE